MFLPPVIPLAPPRLRSNAWLQTRPSHFVCSGRSRARRPHHHQPAHCDRSKTSRRRQACILPCRVTQLTAVPEREQLQNFASFGGPWFARHFKLRARKNIRKSLALRRRTLLLRALLGITPNRRAGHRGPPTPFARAVAIVERKSGDPVFRLWFKKMETQR